MTCPDVLMNNSTEYKGYRLSSVTHRFCYGIEVSGIGVFDGEKELVYTQSIELAKRWVDAHAKNGGAKGQNDHI